MTSKARTVAFKILALTSTDEDQEIIRLLKSPRFSSDRDRGANLLSVKFSAFINAVIRARSVQGAEDKEELLNEVLFEVARTISAYNHSNFKGWIVHITECRVLDFYKYRRAHKRTPTHISLDAPLNSNHRTTGSAASTSDQSGDGLSVGYALHTSDVEDPRHVAEIRDELQQAIGAFQSLYLLPHHRQVFCLHMRGVGGLEIARRLNLSQTNVNLIIHRVKQQIQERVALYELTTTARIKTTDHPGQCRPLGPWGNRKRQHHTPA